MITKLIRGTDNPRGLSIRTDGDPVTLGLPIKS